MEKELPLAQIPVQVRLSSSITHPNWLSESNHNSSPGRFDSEVGMPSSEDNAIQDSLYYQVFSYEVESELQQVEYDTVVKEIAHPAGFVMFSVLKVSENLQKGNRRRRRSNNTIIRFYLVR